MGLPGICRAAGAGLCVVVRLGRFPVVFQLGPVLGLAGTWLRSRALVSAQWSRSWFRRWYEWQAMRAGLPSGASHRFITACRVDDEIPVFIRTLSLYHVVLPVLLFWLVWRLGYDGTAWRRVMKLGLNDESGEVDG